MENTRQFSRRTFIAWVGGAGAGFYLFGRLPGMDAPAALAAVPGGSLDPLSVPKYQTPLLIPPVMPKADTIVRRGQTVDYYEISMRQFTQQILPAGLPATTVWGYGAVRSARATGRSASAQRAVAHDRSASEPAGAGEVDQRAQGWELATTCRICFRSTRRCTGPIRPAAGGRDERPTFTETPGPIHGPGADGHPRARRGGRGRRQRRLRGGVVSTRGQEHPPGLRLGRAPGTASSRPRPPGRTASDGAPGFAVFQYPNQNRASTIWYHDHALGMTRLNVYAGPAGFYMIRGGPAGDDAVIDTRSGSRAVLPGPAPTGERLVPAEQDLLRDPDRDPGSSFDSGWLAVLSGLAGVLRRDRARLHPGYGVLADLEPRVLREHDHGQRQHLAVPDGGAAPLPVPVPRRLPVAVPDPGFRRHPREWRCGRSETRAGSSPPR